MNAGPAGAAAAGAPPPGYVCRACGVPGHWIQSCPAIKNAGSNWLEVPGNWQCSFCSNVNFSQRTACHRCGEPRPPSTGLEARSGGACAPGSALAKPASAQAAGAAAGQAAQNPANSNLLEVPYISPHLPRSP